MVITESMYDKELEPENPQAKHVRWCIKQYGGVLATAMICGIERTGVSKWKDKIPSDHILTLYAYSKAHHMRVDLCHLDPSRFLPAHIDLELQV